MKNYGRTPKLVAEAVRPEPVVAEVIAAEVKQKLGNALIVSIYDDGKLWKAHRPGNGEAIEVTSEYECHQMAVEQEGGRKLFGWFIGKEVSE